MALKRGKTWWLLAATLALAGAWLARSSLTAGSANAPASEAAAVSAADSNQQVSAAVFEWPTLSTTTVISGLDQPTYLTHAGDGSGRIFVVEKKGRIRVWSGGQLTTFLDISGRVGSAGSEQGLFSVAFAPDFATSRRFYVDYTNRDCKSNGGCNTVIARFRAGSGNSAADPASEEVLLTVDQPYPNHNGGQVGFGPDGYLYIGMGDGGSGGDPQNHAQDDASLLGKLLRMDVNALSPAPQVVARGLRNPWRFSWDSNGDLYIADVGQNRYEEVDYVAGGNAMGLNFGWHVMEGTHCYQPTTGCPTTGFVLPVAEYAHGAGDCSITGGYVYRGSRFPRMQGIYFYADYCSGRVWGLRHDPVGWSSELLADTSYAVTSFGLDEAGNLYAVAFGGQVVLIGDSAPPPSASPTPSLPRRSLLPQIAREP
jgi:glucose/arabinose dehydrogenase